MKWTVWWGGFGLGVWRSVYPEGPIWSVAVGPATFLFRASRLQSERDKEAE